MSYTVTNDAQFRARSQGKRKFRQLYADDSWRANASAWGTAELYASRAISMPEQNVITPLSTFYSQDDVNNANARLKAFIAGFRDMERLPWLSEPDVVRQSSSDALGIIWAAIGAFLRKDLFSIGIYGPTDPSRPAINLGALVEDATVHLVSSAVRYLLNSKQSPSTQNKLSWRDERVRYRYSRGQDPNMVVAEDDGGIQIWVPGSQTFRQVALMEAKRDLNNLNGNLQVPDEVLAQMVGQAIAVQRADQTSSNYIAAGRNLSVSILATNRFMRFYAFEFDNDYFQSYEDMDMGTNGYHLNIHPTEWIDMQREDHREQLLRHVAAIIRWANTL
ncbi:hypothetical protein ACQKWADRAFT_309301 [Trichoderma austrokoningii]